MPKKPEMTWQPKKDGSQAESQASDSGASDNLPVGDEEGGTASSRSDSSGSLPGTTVPMAQEQSEEKTPLVVPEPPGIPKHNDKQRQLSSNAPFSTATPVSKVHAALQKLRSANDSHPIKTGIALNVALAAFTALVPKLFKSSSTHFFSKHPLKVAAVFGILNATVAPQLAQKVLLRISQFITGKSGLVPTWFLNLVNQIPQPYSSFFTAASVTAAVRLVLTTKSTRWLAKLLDVAQKMAMILAPLLRMAVEGVFVGIVLILVVSWAQGLWAHVSASTKKR